MIYEYECRVCGNVIDASHSALAEHPRMLFCLKCDRMRPVKKILSKCNFVLKGDGWANDGYSKGSKK